MAKAEGKAGPKDQVPIAKAIASWTGTTAEDAASKISLVMAVMMIVISVSAGLIFDHSFQAIRKGLGFGVGTTPEPPKATATKARKPVILAALSDDERLDYFIKSEALPILNEKQLSSKQLHALLEEWWMQRLPGIGTPSQRRLAERLKAAGLRSVKVRGVTTYGAATGSGLMRNGGGETLAAVFYCQITRAVATPPAVASSIRYPRCRPNPGLCLLDAIQRPVPCAGKADAGGKGIHLFLRLSAEIAALGATLDVVRLGVALGLRLVVLTLQFRRRHHLGNAVCLGLRLGDVGEGLRPVLLRLLVPVAVAFDALDLGALLHTVGVDRRDNSRRRRCPKHDAQEPIPARRHDGCQHGHDGQCQRGDYKQLPAFLTGLLNAEMVVVHGVDFYCPKRQTYAERSAGETAKAQLALYQRRLRLLCLFHLSTQHNVYPT